MIEKDKNLELVAFFIALIERRTDVNPQDFRSPLSDMLTARQSDKWTREFDKMLFSEIGVTREKDEKIPDAIIRLFNEVARWNAEKKTDSSRAFEARYHMKVIQKRSFE